MGFLHKYLWIIIKWHGHMLQITCNYFTISPSSSSSSSSSSFLSCWSLNLASKPVGGSANRWKLPFEIGWSMMITKSDAPWMVSNEPSTNPLTDLYDLYTPPENPQETWNDPTSKKSEHNLPSVSIFSLRVYQKKQQTQTCRDTQTRPWLHLLPPFGLDSLSQTHIVTHEVVGSKQEKHNSPKWCVRRKPMRFPIIFFLADFIYWHRESKFDTSLNMSHETTCQKHG